MTYNNPRLGEPPDRAALELAGNHDFTEPYRLELEDRERRDRITITVDGERGELEPCIWLQPNTPGVIMTMRLNVAEARALALALEGAACALEDLDQ
jgi:hypothetical protein